MSVELQNCKFLNMIPAGAIKDNASFTSVEVDTQGYDYMTVVVALGATDIAMAALQLTESETSATGHAAITGMVWGTSTNTAGSTSSLPSATDDNKLFVMRFPLAKRMRYIDITATAGNGTAGTYLSAIAILSRGDSVLALQNASQVLQLT